jgi:hypothetical protein
MSDRRQQVTQLLRVIQADSSSARDVFQIFEKFDKSQAERRPSLPLLKTDVA